MEPLIRRATLDDVDDIVALRLGLQPTDDPAIIERLQLYLRERIPTLQFAAWVADADGVAVSTMSVIRVDLPPGGRSPTGRDGHMVNVYTHPDWRGRGLATRLLEAVIAWGREQGLEKLWLRATEQGRRVYERAGFTERPALTYMALDLADVADHAI